MGPTSIRLRLTLFFVATSSAVLIGVGSLIGLQIEAHFEEQDVAEMSGKLELIAHALSKVYTHEELQNLPQQLDDALVGHPGLIVALADDGGTVVYPAAGAEVPMPLWSGARAGPARAISWHGGGKSYRGLAQTIPAGLPGAADYRVAVALEVSRHREFMAALQRMLAIAVSLGILASCVLGWLAARRGLAPLRDIAGLVGSVSASRLDNRLRLDSVPAELTELANAFNAMLARLDESFKRLSEFSGDLAHELRTPVSNLLTQTQVVLTKSRSAEEYREILYSSLEEYERLARMVGDMLFLAKADHGLVVPNRESVQLASEIDRLIEFYEALAEELGVTLQRAGDGVVSGDRLMIRRALSNLVSNAIRHTPRGGKVGIEVAPAPADKVRIRVSNEGVEIEARHLERLFDRFYRVDPSRRREGEGVGLGLAITRSIVAAHGGTISAESAAGVTHFDVLLDEPAP